MIEINLLPGARKRPARGASIDVAAIVAGLKGRVKDTAMLGGIAAAVVGIAALAFMYVTQSRERAAVDALAEKASHDSAHYAGLFKSQVEARAKRDTVLRQVNLIRSIDQDRYVWSHIMDEVSRALPAYTWLTGMELTGTAQGAVNNAALPPAPKAPAGDSAKKAVLPKPLPTDIPSDSITVKIAARSVDLETMPRFMRMLEASPFLGNVSLINSDLVRDPASGQDVTQFEFAFRYTRPDTMQLRRVPFIVKVK